MTRPLTYNAFTMDAASNINLWRHPEPAKVGA
jgi:hypothetical protein